MLREVKPLMGVLSRLFQSPATTDGEREQRHNHQKQKLFSDITDRTKEGGRKERVELEEGFLRDGARKSPICCGTKKSE